MLGTEHICTGNRCPFKNLRRDNHAYLHLRLEKYKHISYTVRFSNDDAMSMKDVDSHSVGQLDCVSTIVLTTGQIRCGLIMTFYIKKFTVI